MCNIFFMKIMFICYVKVFLKINFDMFFLLLIYDMIPFWFYKIPQIKERFESHSKIFDTKVKLDS